jgi:lambda repressor-like predicted transcriptional regulator
MEHMPRGEKTPDAAIKAVESMAHEGKSIGKISIKTGLAQSTVTNIIARMRKKSEMTINQDFEEAVQKMDSAISKAKEPAPAATDTSSQTKLPTVSISPEPEKVKHYFSQAILEAAENAITLQADELCRISAQQARYQEQIDALREKITALDELYTYEAAELDRLQSDYTFMVGGLEHE